MDHGLRLMTVHAHPDDESSKGSATVARYHADGVGTALVCCTGGEAGDILNPAMDRPEVRENLGEIRRAELERAAQIIGYDEVFLLGYRDSGMKDTEANEHPDCFARADLTEAIRRMVALVRRQRPHVIVTYSDDQQGYQHPDHVRVNDVSVPAFELAGDPDAYPGLGDPWQPLKLYYTVWSRERIHALHQKYIELGLESPYDDRWFTRPSDESKVTTRVPVGDWYHVRSDALMAHATQVDPTSRFWFGLPTEVARTVHPWDDYVLARSLVPTEVPEDDLFAGVREVVNAGRCR
ncbi:MAG TPA: mycothiol conjugate amidase Mca [Acidimicrobiales bacterium]|jgi:mycothiol S-conjugate amidase|nr:mycothiol conjugate amidase Mca [Acidimicrobiales bacterium]